MKKHIYQISSKSIRIAQLKEVLKPSIELVLSNSSKRKILKCRQFLDRKIQGSDQLHYGINTGFGSLCNVKISGEELETLQANLVRSHASGIGEEVPEEVVRLMLFLKIQSLAYGHSAISMEVIERLIFFFNHKIYPVVYQQGSLGASGDLAPLSHLALPLIGEGLVRYKGKKQSTKTVMKKLGFRPLPTTIKRRTGSSKWNSIFSSIFFMGNDSCKSTVGRCKYYGSFIH